MHELSIAMSIVDIADEEMRKHHAQSIECIELEIGTMAGVELDALRFVWDSAVKNTVLDGVAWHINVIEAKARCMDCGCEFQVKDRFEACPLCHDYLTEFVQGKELKIKSLSLIGSTMNEMSYASSGLKGEAEQFRYDKLDF